MVDEPTFPLYRLPSVALKVAFDCLHPQNILHLSMVSRKSYFICKVFRKKVRNLSVRFDHFNDICSEHRYIFFYARNSPEDLLEDSKLESLRIKDTVFQFEMDKVFHTLSFYIDDRLACLTTLSEYLTDFYGVSLDDVTVDGDSLTALNGVLARQKTLPFCRFYCSKSGDEEVRWFLDRIEDRVTRMLCLDVKTSEHFRLDIRHPVERIHFGGWHTLSIDNFSELNFRGLFAEKTSLTCEYLNSYLKNWQNGGGNPNLECLELRLNLLNVDTVLNGIEFIHRHHPNNVLYGYFMGFFPWVFEESYEIKRNDGTIASIVMKNEVNAEFKLCIWPDVYGTVYPEPELAAE